VSMASMPTAEDVSDAEAVSSSLLDPARFAVIFERHYEAVYRYAARRMGAERAEDVASRTFVVAFERRARFRASSTSARPWLLGIATNVLHESRRGLRRELGLLARLQRDHGREAGIDDGDGAVGAALSQLSAAHRDVLLLHAWEDLSYEEVAVALGVPVGTVRSRLARARAQLRQTLDERRSDG
jgi:RNA polymerase sigma factor (sigma-70 family)